MLVSQAFARIEHFRREPAGGWHYTAHGPGERVQLATGASLDIDAIFAGVFDLPGGD